LLKRIEDGGAYVGFVLSFQGLEITQLIEGSAKLVFVEFAGDLLLGHFVEESTILKLLSTSHRLKDALLERSTLVATRLELGDASAHLLRVVVLEAANVGEVLLVFLSTQSAEFLRNRLVVGHIDVCHLKLEHATIGISQKAGNLLLHAVTLSEITRAEFRSVALLESLEVEADGVLLEELSEFLRLVEGRRRELEAPPGSIAFLQGTPGVLSPRIVDHHLVVIALAERPGTGLIEAMVDDWHVGIRRVSIKRFTLSVVVNKLLISVSCWENRGRAHSTALLGHERLHTLEVVGTEQLVIIHVAQLHRVILNALMETREWVVVHGAFAST